MRKPESYGNHPVFILRGPKTVLSDSPILFSIQQYHRPRCLVSLVSLTLGQYLKCFYSTFYSGKNPEFKEGDVFRIIVPLDETYSYDHDFGRNSSVSNVTKETKSATKDATKATKERQRELNLSEDELLLLKLIHERNNITQKQLHEKTGISLGTIKRILPRLQEKGVLQRIGGRKAGKWLINE